MVRRLPRLLVPAGRARRAAFRSSSRPSSRSARHFVAAPALGLSRLAVNDYKGASYARRLPEAKKVFESYSPFGFLEAYTTSYLHFAPGLSDNAGFNLPEMPANAYMGLYIDSDGPIGVMRHLSDKETAYFRFLPMYYPYVIKKAPKTFITQFGGGISTEVALASGSKDVTVAEGNRAILAAFRDPVLQEFHRRHPQQGPRHRLRGPALPRSRPTRNSTSSTSASPNSTGLSNPGGFAVVEKFPYTQEAMETYMRALAAGGVLAVTIWNKEEPPKSVLKLYATMAAASRALDGDHMADSFFVSSSYLSTATVLYKRGGFTRGRDRQAAQAYARHVVRRDLFAGPVLRRLADRSHARRLCRAVLLGAEQRAAGLRQGGRRRSDRAAGERPDRARRQCRRPAARPTTACCPRP